MESSYQDILTLLNTANKTLEKQLFVPSLDKTITSKPLNASHTKKIVKLAMRGPFAENQFTIDIYGILKEVLDVSLEDINVLDKSVILTQLRAYNISPELSIHFPNKNISKSINLHKHIERISKTDSMKNNMSTTVVENNITGRLGYASVTEEYHFEEYLAKTYISQIDPKDPIQIKGIVEPMFINNISMFIKELHIGDTIIDMTRRSVVERIGIVGNLPSLFLTAIIDKIDNIFGKKLQEITTVSKQIDGDVCTSQFNIDAEFFLK